TVAPNGKKSYLQLYLESLDDKDMTPGLLQQFPLLKRNWEKELEIRKKQEAETDPAKQLPLVLLRTNKGDITLELFEDDAPNTVANFINLIESGFYKNLTFHRVLGTFMAQGGDPNGTGSGGPGYTFDCECRQPNARKHFRGSISMANAGPDTNGSQFFLMFTPNASLDGRHTVFGRIVDGIDVLSDIQRINPEEENQPAPDRIIDAKVLRKRDHNYEPVKNNKRTR
ncbi:MAG: peptidylprolyl isomerase, partial [Thermoguttaceae bacterium]